MAKSRPPYLGGIHLSGRRARCLEPSRRGLVDRRDPAHRVDPGRIEHGAAAERLLDNDGEQRRESMG